VEAKQKSWKPDQESRAPEYPNKRLEKRGSLWALSPKESPSAYCATGASRCYAAILLNRIRIEAFQRSLHPNGRQKLGPFGFHADRSNCAWLRGVSRSATVPKAGGSQAMAATRI